MDNSFIFNFFMFGLNLFKEVFLPVDKIFLDTIDFFFIIRHYQPTPLRWLIIDTMGNVTILSYSVVCTEEAVAKTLESIAGNPVEVELFKQDLRNFCIENGFSLKSALLIKIFKGISLLAKIKKPNFDYKKKLVFPERKIKALFFINVIKQVSHSITLLIYSDKEFIRKDEQKFNFFKFILLRNIRKDYSTNILYENSFYKFYNGWFS